MRGVRRLCSVLGLSEHTISNPDVWVPSPIDTPQYLFLKDRVKPLSLSSVTRATVQGEIKCSAFKVSSNEAPRSWIHHAPLVVTSPSQLSGQPSWGNAAAGWFIGLSQLPNILFAALVIATV